MIPSDVRRRLTLGNQLGSDRVLERDMVDMLNEGREEEQMLSVATAT
jgi:hypothetical protein